MHAIRQMQLSTSDILQIQLPPEFINRTVEVIVLLQEEPLQEAIVKRHPPISITGKGKTIGDLVQPLLEENEWDCLK